MNSCSPLSGRHEQNLRMFSSRWHRTRNSIVTSAAAPTKPLHSLKKIAGTLALAVSLAVGVTACTGDRALFPETSYSEVSHTEIELTKPVTLFGKWEFPEGTHVTFENLGLLATGHIVMITSPKDVTLDDVAIPAKSQIHLVGGKAVNSVTLGEDAEYKGLSFKAKDTVSFTKEGSVAQAVIASTRTFDGKAYPPETALWFKDDSVTRSETQADRDKAAADRDRELRACQAGCAPYSGEAWGNCMGHCSTI
jgi:hypothetical protein